MNKIEVLRSDVSIKNLLLLANHNIKSVSAHEADSMKISALLKQTGISNVEIEHLVDAYASKDPLIGSRKTELVEKPETMVPDDREIYTYEYSRSIKNNKPLEHNYVDEIRGNVIRVDSHDSTYMREYDFMDHQTILSADTIALTNTHNQYKKFFLITDAINNNKISNCFQGHNLEHGAALSFWVKYFSQDTARNSFGLFVFLGDQERHYFDESARLSEREYIDYTTHLSVTTDLCVEYDEAFANNYTRKRNHGYSTPGKNHAINKAMWRSDKTWMHVIVSFTNTGVERFVNGIRVTDDYLIQAGKRFALEEAKERTNVLDFLKDRKTELYLALTLDETKTSEAMLFDDITFWDQAISNEEQAIALFEEAKKINLP